jgi:hypothetical protein
MRVNPEALSELGVIGARLLESTGFAQAEKTAASALYDLPRTLPALARMRLMEQSFGDDLPASREARRGVLSFLRSDLARWNYPDAARLSGETATEAQLLGELANHAGKEASSDFYVYKPFLVRLALEHGAEGGWDRDGLFRLFTPKAGVNGFHDYSDNLKWLLTDEQNALRWPHPWTGVHRQSRAYNLIQSYLGDGQELQRMAYATTPTLHEVSPIRTAFGKEGIAGARQARQEQQNAPFANFTAFSLARMDRA